MASESSSSSRPQFVTVGDVITAESGFITGHGTEAAGGVDGKQLVATVSGFVARTGKLISVRPLATRYTGDIGDVVVGRIIDVGDKRWGVDIGSRQNAILLLASVNLPGGVQRRRTHEDSLQIRAFFQENDLISAEVQKLMGDGALSLHTRNLKYGKLENGQFLRVPTSLIKRCKQHFHSLRDHDGHALGVDVIIGTNGYIWLTATPETPSTATAEHKDKDEGAPAVTQVISKDIRDRISRVRNAIIVLSRAYIAIYRETIIDVYTKSLSPLIGAHEMLHPRMVQSLTEEALRRRAAER